jgi:hypothetical protein
LELPVQLADVHDVFHISQLKKGFGPHDKEPLPLEDLNIKVDLTIVEHRIRILETMTRVARNSVSRCAKYSGVIMQRMRQHGKERMS